jgi:hypothetical protein
MAQESMPFHSFSKTATILIIIAAILSVSGYLLASALTYHLGFPLDDAWIHQTYARNLANYGEWSFVPHQTSGGSTAPLWSVLLVPGVWLGLSPLPWAYLLGTCTLISLAFFSEFLSRRISPEYRTPIPWVGIFIALEWHLVWAAASGMETLLSGLIITLVLGLLALGSRNYLGIGLLIGIGVWVRPDTVTLLGPATLVIFMTSSIYKSKIGSLAKLFIGFAVILAFYFLFNLFITGTPFPNTFYAKQAEYAIFQMIPLYLRFLKISLLPITGVGIFLVPGIVLLLVRAIKIREWGILAGMIWFVCYIAIYAWRLPVTYQHGRYLIPAMPIYFVFGLSGMLSFIYSLSLNRWKWVVSKVWQISTGLILISFWLLGARAFGTDVAIIETEMVATAKWVAANVPPGRLIAAHDIGALGYFAPRNIVDLAGLISPEVIPFIRDEEQLAQYLDRRNVEYLMTFPDWYPVLVKSLPVAFSSNGRFAPSMGQVNMAVYFWKNP